MKFEKHIEIDNGGQTAVDILCETTALTKQVIKQVMTKGAVWLSQKNNTRRVRRADRILKQGDSLHIYYDDIVLEQLPVPAQLVADEGLYSLWDKPCGMLCQGSKWGDHCTINRYVEKNLHPQRPAFIVHRLDRAATGLILIAHQKKIAAYFSRLFQQRQVEKKYSALVEGELVEPMVLNTKVDDKLALSRIKPLDYNLEANQSLVEVTIATGRKHQIRRHLSGAGFPIVGDRLYGGYDKKSEWDLCLTSCYLSFVSPVDRKKQSYSLKKVMPSWLKSTMDI